MNEPMSRALTEPSGPVTGTSGSPAWSPSMPVQPPSPSGLNRMIRPSPSSRCSSSTSPDSRSVYAAGPQNQLPSRPSRSSPTWVGVHAGGQYGSPSARIASRSDPRDPLKPLVELHATIAVSAPGASVIWTTATKPGIDPVWPKYRRPAVFQSEEHTSELQSQSNLVCRLLLEKKKTK